jgi:cytochrome c-type biogenesis protein CcmH/NrfG
MQPAISAFARLIVTVAAVSVVVAVNRPAQGDQASADAVRCELDPPRDVAGLEACVARSPRDVELLVQLAGAYEASGRTEDARSMYRRAIEADPRDADAQRRLAESLRR